MTNGVFLGGSPGTSRNWRTRFEAYVIERICPCWVLATPKKTPQNDSKNDATWMRQGGVFGDPLEPLEIGGHDLKHTLPSGFPPAGFWPPQKRSFLDPLRTLKSHAYRVPKSLPKHRPRGMPETRQVEHSSQNPHRGGFKSCSPGTCRFAGVPRGLLLGSLELQGIYFLVLFCGCFFVVFKNSKK